MGFELFGEENLNFKALMVLFGRLNCQAQSNSFKAIKLRRANYTEHMRIFILDQTAKAIIRLGHSYEFSTCRYQKCVDIVIGSESLAIENRRMAGQTYK